MVSSVADELVPHIPIPDVRSIDQLMAADPQTLSDMDILCMVEELRAQRAQWANEQATKRRKSGAKKETLTPEQKLLRKDNAKAITLESLGDIEL